MRFRCLPSTATTSVNGAGLSSFGDRIDAAGDVDGDGVGDVDGDGIDDALVGIPGQDLGGSGAGAAALILGAAPDRPRPLAPLPLCAAVPLCELPGLRPGPGGTSATTSS